MEGRWPNSCYFVGYFFLDLSNIARSIFVQFPSSLFSKRLVTVHVVHQSSRIDRTTVGKILLNMTSWLCKFSSMLNINPIHILKINSFDTYNYFHVSVLTKQTGMSSGGTEISDFLMPLTKILKNYIQELPQRSSFASSNVFIKWWPWIQAWFRGRSIITTNPEHPSSISQYYQTLVLWESVCVKSVF